MAGIRERIKRRADGNWTVDAREFGFGKLTFATEIQALACERQLRLGRVQEYERGLLPLVVELRRFGVKTLGGLARELNARGVKTGKGGDWYPATVKRLVEASTQLERDPPHILGRRCTRRGIAVTAAAIKAKKQAADQRASVLLPLIVEMRCSGETSLRKAAAKLNGSGLTAPRGGQCYAMTVKRALARRQRASCPVTRREQDAVRRAQAVKYEQWLERRLWRLIDRGCDSTVALSPELNRLGWLSLKGLPWSVNSLGQYVSHHLPAIWSLIRARGSLDGLLWQEIRARFVEAERVGIRARRALSEFFNRRRQRTPSGHQAAWNEWLIQHARKRLGLGVQSKAEQRARLAHAKRIHDGIARREGIDREPFSLRTRAAKMTAKGTVTAMGLPFTEQRLRGSALYRGAARGRRDARYWSAERKAEFDALVEAGCSVGEIAWDLGISESAVRSRRRLQRQRESH
jgi:hypothetical protein